MEVCKVCNKEFKKVTDSHIKTHKMSRKEYDAIEGTPVSDATLTEFENIEDLPVETPITLPDKKVSRMDRIFDKKDRKYADRPLSDFLEKYDIDEKSLTGLVLKYKTGSEIPVSQQMEKRVKDGEKEANKVAGEDKVEVHSVWEADALVKQHGYTCNECLRIKGRKTWFLSK